MIRILILIILIFSLHGCGKVGPLSLPENQVDKSIITYPCDEACLERLEEEKKRQQTLVIETE
tara:strand:- start:10 stop:198 length:189 start_codon:yes stop_codon:yes gene_type:complete